MLCRQFLPLERAFSGRQLIHIVRPLMGIRNFSTKKKQTSVPPNLKENDPTPPQAPSVERKEVPLLHYAGLGLVSYGAIYLSMLGFSYIGLEMSFLSCEMVGVSSDACVTQFVKSASTVQPITAEMVKNDPSLLQYAEAIGINRALKLVRMVMSGILSLGIAPLVGVPASRDEYKQLLFIYGASLMESNIENYV